MRQPVLGLPVLGNSLREMTGKIALEKFSESTELLVLVILLMEISWVSTMFVKDTGFQCLEERVIKALVLGSQLQHMALLI